MVKIYRQTETEISVQFPDDLNLSDRTAKMSLVKVADGSTALTITEAEPDIVDNKITLTLTTAQTAALDTGRYVGDVVLVDADDEAYRSDAFLVEVFDGITDAAT